ncbi:MAG: polysaccharide biosynthesis/export family protein [Candidatus Omnitrophica bacterium]|nr:polysaccharide biosynthesis/export family protein [Candidatus Omnitrophota bacterium]
MDGRLTITEVAKEVGVTPRTIMRWEKSGKIKKSKRDWRGWRFYHKEDLDEIKNFFETAYEYDEENGSMVRSVLSILLILSLAILGFCSVLSAETNFTSLQGVTETADSVNITLDQLPAMGTAEVPIAESVKYTLGPNDVIEIIVRRHPEFSGQYAINSEGKIEYKFVGDIIVDGLTKAELKDRLHEVLSEYIIEPEINVTIVAYLSKVIYVVGDVNRPGKFYMKGNSVTVREALVQAGLPNGAAAMRKTRLITPNSTGEEDYIKVDIQKLLYEGDLSQNLEMNPGDVLYVPPTVMAKIIRVISPVTGLVGQTTGTYNNAIGVVP